MFCTFEIESLCWDKIEIKDLLCLFSGLNEILDQNFDWIIGYMIMMYFFITLYFVNRLFQKKNASTGICENSQRIVVGYQLPP